MKKLLDREQSVGGMLGRDQMDDPEHPPALRVRASRRRPGLGSFTWLRPLQTSGYASQGQ
jgi:hypothetical protein